MHTGNASGDDDDVGILESRLGAVIRRKVASGFLLRIIKWEPEGLITIALALTAFDEMWERSAATPGVLTTSYRASSSTSGESFRSKDKG